MSSNVGAAYDMFRVKELQGHVYRQDYDRMESGWIAILDRVYGTKRRGNFGAKAYGDDHLDAPDPSSLLTALGIPNDKIDYGPGNMPLVRSSVDVDVTVSEDPLDYNDPVVFRVSNVDGRLYVADPAYRALKDNFPY